MESTTKVDSSRFPAGPPMVQKNRIVEKSILAIWNRPPKSNKVEKSIPGCAAHGSEKIELSKSRTLPSGIDHQSRTQSKSLTLAGPFMVQKKSNCRKVEPCRAESTTKVEPSRKVEPEQGHPWFRKSRIVEKSNPAEWNRPPKSNPVEKSNPSRTAHS